MKILAAVSIIAGGLIVYANSIDAPFLFDDGPAILRNSTIRDLTDLGTVLQPPAEGAGVTGRPVVNLSLAVNYAFGGLAVRGYHLMNVALHGLVCLVLWAVLRRTLGREVVPACCREHTGILAWGITLLWAVHPLLTETVVCVVQRNEILAGLFYLLTLYGFIRAAESPVPWRWQFFAVVACALGMASKEVVATAPLMVWLYDRTFVAGSFRATGRRKYFYAALAATWAIVVWLTLGNDGRAGTVGFDLGVSSWSYLLTQCRALTIYLGLSFWPHPLVVDYGTTVVKSAGEVWAQGLLVLGLLGATSWALWRRPVWGFIGAWFFVILAPSSSFVPLTTQTIAEHRMYLPLVAVIAATLIAALRLIGCRGLVLVVLGSAVGLGWATVQRNVTYQSELALWTDTLAHDPQNARAQASLGYYFVRQEQWAEAEMHYAEAIRLVPGYADAHHDLGQVFDRQNRLVEAFTQYEIAQRLKPEDPVINSSYGAALLANGRGAEAIAPLEAALRARPEMSSARNNLARVFASLNRSDEALAQYREGLRRDPADAALRAGLADLLFDLSQLEEAAKEYGHLLEMRPALTVARHNLALSLAQLGRPEEAIAHYQQVLREMPGSALAHFNFSLALERVGRVNEAIAEAEVALQLDPRMVAVREQLARLRAK